MKQIKNIDIITRHDAILCREKDILMVKNFLINEITLQVGIVPTIKTELITN